MKKLSPKQYAFCAAASAGIWGMWSLVFNATWQGSTVVAILWFTALTVLMSWAEGGVENQ